MGLGQSPFPVPEIIVDELKCNAFQKDYLPVKGLLELRRAVAEHHNHTFGIDCTESILFSDVNEENVVVKDILKGKYEHEPDIGEN